MWDGSLVVTVAGKVCTATTYLKIPTGPLSHFVVNPKQAYAKTCLVAQNTYHMEDYSFFNEKKSFKLCLTWYFG